MRIYEPTWQEKFSLWVNLAEVELTFELITYYLVCSLFGLLTGVGIGNRIMWALSRLM